MSQIVRLVGIERRLPSLLPLFRLFRCQFQPYPIFSPSMCLRLD